MKISRSAGILAVLLVVATLAQAQSTIDWTNVAGGTFSVGGNWQGGVAPGATDTARFTNAASYGVIWSGNAANSDALFDAPSGTVTADVGVANAWTLTNTLKLGQSSGAAGTLLLTNGTMVVSNAAGTANVKMGNGGSGVFQIQGQGGALYADTLTLTNASTNGNFDAYLKLGSGTLTTRNGVTIQMATNAIGGITNDFFIGNMYSGPGTFTWYITGGTNSITTYGSGNDTMIGGGINNSTTRGIVYVSGSNTVWTNSGRLSVGSAQAWNAHESVKSNELYITDGARVDSAGATIGWYYDYSKAVVSGTNSAWYSSKGLSVAMGVPTEYCSLTISNGGKIVVTGGGSAFGSSGVRQNRIIITGTNSLLQDAGGYFYVYGDGGSNEITVADGGTFIATTVAFGMVGSARNKLLITDPGSYFTNSQFQMNGYTNETIITNGGRMVTADLRLYALGNVIRVYTNSILEGGGYIANGYLDDRPGLELINGGLYRSVNVYLGLSWVAGYTGSVLVAGNGSVWTNSGEIRIGTSFSNNAGAVTVKDGGLLVNDGGPIYVGEVGQGSLTVTNLGVVRSQGNVTVGNNPALSSNNVLTVYGGTLSVTNAAATGTLDVRRGALTVGGGGIIRADKFLFTNAVDTISFVANTNGPGRVYVNSNFTIDSNSKLNIDLRDYNPYNNEILTLISYGSMPTQFNPNNITVQCKYGTKIVQGSGVNDQLTVRIIFSGTIFTGH